MDLSSRFHLRRSRWDLGICIIAIILNILKWLAAQLDLTAPVGQGLDLVSTRLYSRKTFFRIEYSGGLVKRSLQAEPSEVSRHLKRWGNIPDLQHFWIYRKVRHEEATQAVSLVQGVVWRAGETAHSPATSPLRPWVKGWPCQWCMSSGACGETALPRELDPCCIVLLFLSSFGKLARKEGLSALTPQSLFPYSIPYFTHQDVHLSVDQKIKRFQ